MYEVRLLNLINGEKFNKLFNSEYLMNKFVNKCKYSKKLKIISIFILYDKYQLWSQSSDKPCEKTLSQYW